jgi:hypothetical protein
VADVRIVAASNRSWSSSANNDGSAGRGRKSPRCSAPRKVAPSRFRVCTSSISGTPDRRFALINNETFAKGDQATVKVGDKQVMVHCIEIRESSVVVSIEGIDGTRELKLP